MNANSKLLLLLACLPLTLMAQRYSSPLDSVPATGFYRIALEPGLARALKTDYSDLRLLDENNRQVPYALRPYAGSRGKDGLLPLPIIRRETADSGKTSLVMENNTGLSLNHIRLSMASSAVRRMAALSGSNDNSNWFIIDDAVELVPGGEGGGGSFTQDIRFPNNNYRYYKLLINNLGRDPLNVTGAGIYRPAEQASPAWFQNPAPQIMQVDSSNGFSYVEVKWPAPYPVARIGLLVSGSRFFKRRVELRLPVWDRKGIETGMSGSLGEFYIASDKRAQLSVPVFKSNRFYLIINNQDNPPLRVDSVLAEYGAMEAVAWLEKNHRYHLLLNNPGALAPEYDLVSFNDSIPAGLPLLAAGPLAEEKNPAPVKKEQLNRKWIWPALILVILLLALLTWKLSKEVKHEKE